ncbi:molecular chaperone Hsp90 [Amycolatopsis acidiphila]|uniref:Molecular chaperone Hsp90 n=1 Tax=Amycolatopsis acidiphila TaxID=715473 RepID=A0A558AJQ7_9PSEU|nr:molecular chaperone Hsp90 [Amycolatopsis acidiphila]TVT24493.1 molecular chaperone Hsp90 [Amycolatopsis acidiphila]UIJ59296.1 molecular chaperone Hsp90 [Amycolatopsis acidiphila]GHG79564.1 molecular chaperone Hsp90 [Amycolatopsis acidiphila]
MSLPSTDPFGTEELRASVLRAWSDSPTRLLEDTNAERDLRVGAYRDRLFVELAQNAADAAVAAGIPGTLRVSVVDGELRVANTGAPLDARGVASLSSLRASAKEGLVGQFGVGFAAVLAVSSEPRVLSRTGGVAFSEARTREAVSQDEVPVLRLPWPAGEEVPAGFDTEVRLPLRDGVDPAGLLARAEAEAEDLLLSLPGLTRFEVEGSVWQRSAVDSTVQIAAPDGTVRRWLTQEAPDGLWAVPVDDGPVPLEDDVLHAPTPTDERLSLPARLIASVPMEPSRRRVLPGTDLSGLARSYPALVRKLAPEHRVTMVPKAGFPLSELDGQLREAVLRQLAGQAWLPGVSELAGSGARVLNVESPELTGLLGEIVPRLVSLSGPEVARVLATVDAEPLDVAELVEILTGLERPPAWWHSLYDALLPLLEAHSVSYDDLGALPVPLADGRTLPGPRGAFLFGAADDLLDLLADAEVVGLRLVHPDAAHPLLERLGAKQADSADLLEAPSLREAIERSVEDGLSGLDVRPLADAVLRLVSDNPVEGLGALALPSRDGWRRADELVLPTSPLLAVFDPEALGADGALSVLDNDFAEDWAPGALTAVGVLDGFVVTEDGIRDLDLVADDAWPQALRLLAGERETWHALSGPSGEWIARNAVLAGRAPEEWRLPEAEGLAGLYDPVPDVGLGPEVLTLAGVRAELAVADLDDAADLLDRLGDPDRVVAAGLISRAYAALAAVDLDWSQLDPPARVRAVDGSVVAAEQAAVLDLPWLAAVWPAGRLVAAAAPERLAELLDVPVLSELVSARLPEGEFLRWSELTAVRLVAELLDIPFPEGGVVVHEELTVEVDGVKRTAPWWVESGGFHGEHHAEDSPAGLARAFAWASGHWADRHLITALLDDPDPLTLLA